MSADGPVPTVERWLARQRIPAWPDASINRNWIPGFPLGTNDCFRGVDHR